MKMLKSIASLVLIAAVAVISSPVTHSAVSHITTMTNGVGG